MGDRGQHGLPGPMGPPGPRGPPGNPGSCLHCRNLKFTNNNENINNNNVKADNNYNNNEGEERKSSHAPSAIPNQNSFSSRDNTYNDNKQQNIWPETQQPITTVAPFKLLTSNKGKSMKNYDGDYDNYRERLAMSRRFKQRA